LLVETDAPFLAPVPHRGRRNEPAWVQRTVQALSDARGERPADLAARLQRNFGAFIGTATPP
jgi:TatD DNase family protein